MKLKIILFLVLFITSLAVYAQNTVTLEIKTGSDDLATRDFQENLEIRFKLEGKPDVVLRNANNARNLPNNSNRRITIPLDLTTRIEDIKEIQLFRRNVGNWNSLNDGIADNWNLQKLTITANILKDGVSSKYNLLTVEGTGGNPLFRFIYGPSHNSSEGQGKSFAITQPQLISSTNTNGTTITPTRPSTPIVADRTVISSPVIVAPPSDNKLDIDLKTGTDNLEMKPYQENVEIRIIIQNKPEIVLVNANKGQNWPNNSIRRVSIPLPADITAEAIKEIHIYRRQNRDGESGGGSPLYVWENAEKDNWNLQNINAFATIKTNGVKKRYDFEQIVSTRRGYPLYRFTYAYNNTETEGSICKKAFILRTTPSATPNNTGTTITNVIMDVTIGTGGDDLRGGNDNAEIIFSLHSSSRKILIRNIFNSANLPNWSVRTRTITIPSSTTLDINDIKEVEVRHTGGGGIGADNWHVDKIKISVTKQGESKILVDEVGTPIHMFTGDRRRKNFIVSRSSVADETTK